MATFYDRTERCTSLRAVLNIKGGVLAWASKQSSLSLMKTKRNRYIDRQEKKTALKGQKSHILHGVVLPFCKLLVDSI